MTFDRKFRSGRLNIIQKDHEKFYLQAQLKGVSQTYVFQFWLDIVSCRTQKKNILNGVRPDYVFSYFFVKINLGHNS
jgi:hypothetical protein